MAPELVSDPERVSEKADVWSLGMVLWEMLTRQVPFTHLTPQQIIAGLMVGNLQPEVRRLPIECICSVTKHARKIIQAKKDVRVHPDYSSVCRSSFIHNSVFCRICAHRLRTVNPLGHGIATNKCAVPNLLIPSLQEIPELS